LLLNTTEKHCADCMERSATVAISHHSMKIISRGNVIGN